MIQQDVSGEMFLWLRVQKLMFKGKECQMLTIRDLTKLLSVEKIESENRFFNTLTATVTHEMMTPLNCIITFGRSLLNT
jgi:signal transduction histidine kinase